MSHVINEYGTTDCPVEGVRAFADDDECSACGAKVSDQKLLTINLLRDPTRGWYSANLGWVSDITLASVVSDRVVELLKEVSPNPEHWQVVSFVERPF